MAIIQPPRRLTSTDDRSSFDCGRESMNHWFRRHAWHNHESGVSRISVVSDSITDQIAGYVSLSAAQIEREHFPKAQQRNQPNPIPALLIGQLAVDKRYQGQGIARSLMFFALSTIVRLSKEIGCFCVLTHPLDDGVRAFYRDFGFEDLPFDPRHSMVIRIKELENNGFS